jgi:hypothetical protein
MTPCFKKSQYFHKDEERRGEVFKNPEYLILVQILNSGISYVLGQMEYL